MATQQGPAVAIVARCEGCAWLTPAKIGGRDSRFMRCTHPKVTKDARLFPRNGATPAWCPELPAARLALARSVVAAADDVLCSKCGKPVTTADEKSYRMHSMAGCPR